MIVPGGGFLLPSSRVPGVCLGRGEGMVLDETDTCISQSENGLKIFPIQAFKVQMT